MRTPRIACMVTGLTLLASFACSCSATQPPRTMTMRIHGVLCDPNQATLVAKQTNESQIDDFADLRRVEVYKTSDGHYFAQTEVGNDINLQMLSSNEDEAMQLYSEMTRTPNFMTAYASESTSSSSSTPIRSRARSAVVYVEAIAL
jgi:hypothetical protein